MTETTELERTSLEAHVDLCALRYGQLEERLGKVETKLDLLSAEIIKMRQDFFKIMIGSSASVIVAIIGAVATIYH
jgi:mevalonate kinase